MKPLVFLMTRSIYNGVRRAFSSPRRTIGVIFFLGYYVWLMSRGWLTPSRGGGIPTPERLRFDVPPIDVIDAFVFAGFLFATVFLALGVFGQRGNFSQADVDVLFPTPISPKRVLAFRMLRDSLLTLLLPLIVALFVARPLGSTWTGLVRNLPNPGAAEYTGRAFWISFLLCSAVFVTIGYGTSIYFNRPEERFERQRRWATWGVVVGILAVAAFVAIKIRETGTVEGFVQLAHHPVLRAVFIIATGATNLSMAPITGNVMDAVIGGGILVGLIAGGVMLAMSQAGYVYEEAALRAAQVNQARTMARQGDTFGMLAEQARSGKIKAGKQSWVHRLNPKGPAAILWKEYLLHARSTRFLYFLFPLLGSAIVVAPAIALRGTPRIEAMLGPMMLVVQLMMVFTGTAITAQGGYLEMLRRVDLQKPLPFAPATIVFYEVWSKAWLGIAMSVTSSLAGLIAAPQAWQLCLASLIAMPTLALLLSSVFCLVILMFPDVEDPTQRGFRGLISMLGIALFCAPATVTFIILQLLKVPPIVAALPVAVLNVGLAIVAAVASGKYYATFNPSE